MKYDYLIVGAGLFGAVFAQEAKQAGKKCLVVEKRGHIAGNVYCHHDGATAHTFSTPRMRRYGSMYAVLPDSTIISTPPSPAIGTSSTTCLSI